jgi:hypothetical protein
MRLEIQKLLDEFGTCFVGDDIIERIGGSDDGDGGYGGDIGSLFDSLAELGATFEEHVKVDAFLVEYAEKLEAASRRFSQRVAALQAINQRWSAWRESAQAAGKTELGLGAWRNEVIGTPEQITAFVG